MLEMILVGVFVDYYVVNEEVMFLFLLLKLFWCMMCYYLGFLVFGLLIFVIVRFLRYIIKVIMREV